MRIHPVAAALIGAAIVVHPAGPLHAQRPELSTLPGGARVRVTAPKVGPRVSGTLLSVSSDSVHVLTTPAADTVAVPLASTYRMHVLVGKRRQPGRRSLQGAAAGTALGMLAGFIVLDRAFTDETNGGNGLGTAAGGVFGAGVGAIAGFLNGLRMHDHWQRVHLPPRRR